MGSQRIKQHGKPAKAGFAKTKQPAQKPQAAANGRRSVHTRSKRQAPAKRGLIQVAPNTRRGEVVRAQRRFANDVNLRSSQHLVDTPVNKSAFNGNKGQQVTPTLLKRSRPNNDAVRIITLGGLGEIGIGKNMTIIEYKNELVVVDMGTIFTNEDYPGINYMVQDISYLEANRHKIKAFLFTHAHLDHIGACPILLPKFKDVPIFGTEFTIGMIKKQMEDSPENYQPNYNVVDPFAHKDIKLSQNLSVEFIHVLHSIPGATALVLRTPNGVIVHSGDWRFENHPLKEPFDMPRLLEISQKEGIALLLNESTNIDTPGTHPCTEFDIAESIGDVMDKFDNSRVIISCFSSQISRIQIILEEAAKRGRKVAFAGYSMINAVDTAVRARTINIPKDVVVKIEQTTRLKDGKVVVICTGSQGEINAVLNRMASGEHRFIKIKPTDVVVFSSNPIPGNEPRVVNTVDGLLREGASVIQNGRGHLHGIGPLHLSGHAYYEDHVLFVRTLKPKNYLPIHGQFVMLQHNAEMARDIVGIPEQNILVCDNGDVVELLPDQTIRKNGRVEVGSVMYDNANKMVQEAVVKDRLHLSQQGIVVIVAMVNKKTGRLAKTPDIISRAFVYLKDNEELMSRVRHYLKIKIEKTDLNKADLKSLKNEIRDDVNHILFDSTQKTPIVIPVINTF